MKDDDQKLRELMAKPKPTPTPPKTIVSKLASKISVKTPGKGPGCSKKPERWTPEEHTKFIEAVREHGKNWKKVAEHMDGRDVKLIASHSQ